MAHSHVCDPLGTSFPKPTAVTLAPQAASAATSAARRGSSSSTTSRSAPRSRSCGVGVDGVHDGADALEAAARLVLDNVQLLHGGGLVGERPPQKVRVKLHLSLIHI